MNALYVVVDIGCIECDEASGVVGIFAKKEDAETARDRAADYQQLHLGGVHNFEIFVVDGITEGV